jgi:selenocysteine lyase/cysteine desulfurase
VDKRTFLIGAGRVSLAVLLGPVLSARYGTASAADLAADEPFWAAIRAKFRLTDQYINLENGYYCFLPEEVLEEFVGHVRAVNLEGSHYMRTRKDDDKLRARTALAGLAGSSPDEIIITRNTTESLDCVISGVDWRAGDEAVMANQDYGAMLDMFKLQARRHGVVNRLVDIPMDPRTDAEVIQVYANALTPKTRLLMIPHMVNITGHILPVRAICDMARARNVEVMVDGAHTFAHLDFRIPDLGCEYFGTSLHKWLSVPLGAGLLYVRRDRIADLWPIYGDDTFPTGDIRKLNHTGTHPVHTDLTIERAVAFHGAVGAARKEARLRYLQRHWSERVRSVPRILVNTPTEARRSCGIANVGIAGMPPSDLAKTLFDKYRIFTVAIDGAGVHGVRVTPQIYTSTAELDEFVRALRELAA